jgi:16S rRNA (guanine966-N2)-methyltransferase
MRVISGDLNGRVFAAPDITTTHPMGEKLRGSIFSSLGDIKGLKVLDVYSGSGAMSIESISRGAEHAVAIEANKHAAMVIRQNLNKLNLNNKVKLINAKFGSWSCTSNELFDIVLADPPYDHLDVNEIVKLVNHIKTNGLLVLSWPGKQDLPLLDGVKLIKARSFNDSGVGFYRA